MPDLPHPSDFPWKEAADMEKFREVEWTRRILDGLSVYRPGTNEVDPTRRSEVAKLLHTHGDVILKRLRRLEKAMNEQFIGKETLIRMIFVCAIAQQPMLIVGPPGTAKSGIINRFCEGLGVARMGETSSQPKQGETTPAGNGSQHRSFQYLLHAFTEPDEILGVVDLNKLKDAQPQFRRLREGSITDAEVIFLDEVMRGNSAILNALLTIINERRVYEGGQYCKAKARIIFGASNAPPTPRQLEDLRAFYERFIIRVESAYTPMEFHGEQPPAARVNLLREGWRAEVRDLRGGYDPKASAMAPAACLNDLLLCNRAITECWGGENLDDPAIKPLLIHYHDLVARLAGGPDPDCLIDDRKFIRLFAVVRAHALIRHNAAPQVADLAALRHIWEDLEHRQAVANTVNGYLTDHGVPDAEVL